MIVGRGKEGGVGEWGKVLLLRGEKRIFSVTEHPDTR